MLMPAEWIALQGEGLAVKEEDYKMRVPRSQRGGEVIEPLVRDQWFVRMEPLAKPALQVPPPSPWPSPPCRSPPPSPRGTPLSTCIIECFWHYLRNRVHKCNFIPHLPVG